MAKERFPKTEIITHASAAIGGAAVAFAWQRRKVKHEREKTRDAEHDELTKLPRRKPIYETYDKLKDGSHNRRRGTGQNDPKADQHALIVIDLDNFKDYNDRYGHAAGDNVLKAAAGTLTDRLRESDIVVRWGGEEFVALLPRASEADAALVAEELRKKFEDDGHSASFGVTGLDLDAPFNKNFINADAALYAAKNSGRNQVVAYSSMVTS